MGETATGASRVTLEIRGKALQTTASLASVLWNRLRIISVQLAKWPNWITTAIHCPLHPKNMFVTPAQEDTPALIVNAAT